MLVVIFCTVNNTRREGIKTQNALVYLCKSLFHTNVTSKK